MKPRAAGDARAAPFVTDSPAAAFAHFESTALALPAAELEVYNANLDVVPLNTRRGVDAVRPLLDDSTLHVTPAERRAVLEVPALVLALVHADARVARPVSPGEIAAAQRVLRPLRQSTLAYLEAVTTPSVPALVPAERVRAIRDGRGPQDEARDGVAIVALFREYAAALAGKHPYTEAQIRTLEEKATFLIRALEPSDAASAPSGAAGAEPSPEVRARNGIWTLVVRAYDTLLLIAARKWGVRRLGEHVPALLARAGASSATETQTHPAPPAVPAAPPTT